MDIKKTNETWTRTFDPEGNESGNRLDSAQFDITDSEGNTVGSAYVSSGNLSLNVNLYGFSTVEEGIARLRSELGAE